jgi:hypothetical protein
MRTGRSPRAGLHGPARTVHIRVAALRVVLRAGRGGGAGGEGLAAGGDEVAQQGVGEEAAVAQRAAGLRVGAAQRGRGGVWKEDWAFEDGITGSVFEDEGGACR